MPSRNHFKTLVLVSFLSGCSLPVSAPEMEVNPGSKTDASDPGSGEKEGLPNLGLPPESAGPATGRPSQAPSRTDMTDPSHAEGIDAGSNDASTNQVDSGTGSVDSGSQSPTDAGVGVSSDASSGQVDSGTGAADSGSQGQRDAGESGSNDASTDQVDSGTGAADSGSQSQADAGVKLCGSTTSQCNGNYLQTCVANQPEVSTWCAEGCSAGACIAGPSTATSITAGANHFCVIQSKDTVRCWGGTDVYPLGRGTASTEALYKPNPVVGLSDATKIIAGDAFTCARKANGNVTCWGRNDVYQLGDGTKTDQPVPVTLVGGWLNDPLVITVTDLFWAGPAHVRAGKAGWGKPARLINTEALESVSTREIGCNAFSERVECRHGKDYLNKIVYVLIENATSLVADKQRSAALANGSVVVWDMNLPDDAPTTTTAQASILAFHDASEKGTKLVGKEGHICALSNLGNVYCGGPNGLLMGTANPTASFVPMLADVVDIAMAEGAMCAVKKNGTVWCWGNNDKGQLGQNPATVTSSAQPMQIVDGL